MPRYQSLEELRDAYARAEVPEGEEALLYDGRLTLISMGPESRMPGEVGDVLYCAPVSEALAEALELLAVPRRWVE